MNSFPRHLSHPLVAWVVLGTLAFAALPWYFLQSQSLLEALWGGWGSEGSGSGLAQAMHHGRPWLWSGLAGLLISGLALALPPGQAQGRGLVDGALVGLMGLLGSGFAIGAPGWVFATLEGWWGPLDKGQYGMGWGGAPGLFPLGRVCLVSRHGLPGFAGAVRRVSGGTLPGLCAL